MDKSKVALIPLALCLFAVPVHAYVGPGAGLSLLGALWALVAAIAAAVVFLIAWPIRRMRRRKREAREAREARANERAEADTRAHDAAAARTIRSADDKEELDNLQTQ